MVSNKSTRIVLLSLFLPILCIYSYLYIAEESSSNTKLETINNIDNLLENKFSRDNDYNTFKIKGKFNQNSGMIELEFNPNDNLVTISKISDNQVEIKTDYLNNVHKKL